MGRDSEPARYEDLQQVLKHLESVEIPELPRPPILRSRALLWSLNAFLVTVFVVTPVLAVLLICVPVLFHFWTGKGMGGFLRNGIWAIAVALMVAWVRAVRSRAHEPDDLTEVRREVHPELFELLDGIARRLGTEPVRRVTVAPWSSFSVREERGNRRGSGALHLELDWNDLWGLDLAEFSSILLHEFAHYGIGHTRTAAKLYHRSRYLFELEARLAEDRWSRWSPVYFGVRAFLGWFRRQYAGISRVQEGQADAVAIGLVGAMHSPAGSRRYTGVPSRPRGEWGY